MALLMKGSKNRLLELDALRGIAALFVVLFHFSDGIPSINNFFKFGVTGVNLFFIISGFVIFLTLNNTSSWQDFVFSRFSRLYPTYWTCISITAILTIINAYVTHKAVWFTGLDFIGNITMFQHFFNIPDLDGPYWTLIIEMLFYMCMLVLFYTKTLNKIELIGTIGLIIVTVYDLFVVGHMPKLFLFLRQFFPLLNHFPLFFAGILFYKIKFEKATFFRLLGIVVCFILACMLYGSGGRVRLYLSLYTYAIILIIYFLLWFAYVYNYLGFIVNKATVYLGNISYSVYLIHQFLGVGIIIPGLMKFAHLAFPISFIIALIITISFASVITFYVEKPAISMLRSWYKKRKINSVN